METCLALSCPVKRPLQHTGPYYCDEHGCADCHKEPRHWWCSQRKRVCSEYCEFHHEADLHTQHLAYEVYKRRKMVEAGAVVDEAGDPNTLEHSVFGCDKIPRVVKTGDTDTLCALVLSKVMDKQWKDDLFGTLMECFPRSAAVLPVSVGTDDTIGALVRALSPLTRDINSTLSQKQKGSVIVNYCDYDYDLVRLPRVCPTTVGQRRRVVCKSTGEAMYRLSSIVRKRGTDLYHDTDTYYAWTLPVSFVEGFEAAKKGMLRFEEIVC